MKYLGQIVDGEDLVNKDYVDDEIATKQDLLVSGTNIKTINSESILGSGDITVGGGSGQSTWYGTSSTAASTTAKTTTIDDYVLTKGALVSVYFTSSNTANTLTLNVSSTGAKTVYRTNSAVSSSNPLKWDSNTVVTFMYDGSYYRYISSSASLEKKVLYGSLTGGSNITLSTTSQKIPFSTFDGVGCSLSSNGIKVSDGVYEISGAVYLSAGYTANDIIHIELRKGTSTVIAETLFRAYAANPYTNVHIGPIIETLANSDVIYLYAYNQNGARGTAGPNSGTGKDAGIILHRIA